LLLPGLVLYLEAFQELSTCRPYLGMDGMPGPIPWTAIARYGAMIELEEDALEYFVKMVRALDDEFLTHSRSTEVGKSGQVQHPHKRDRGEGRSGG
jgi:hypothetical protein